MSIAKIAGALASVFDPRCYLHAFRLLHYYGYSHVRERGKMNLGQGTGMAPNLSIRNGARITVGRDCHLGERSYLWAGDSAGEIRIGDCVSIAPGVFQITLSPKGSLSVTSLNLRAKCSSETTCGWAPVW